MQVFKSIFLILKRLFPQVVIYLIAFLPLSFVIGNSMTSQNTNFTQSQCKVAIVNESQNNDKLIDNLKECFSSSMTFSYIDNDTKLIEDLLFYEGVDCVVFFESDYLTKFLNDSKELQVKYRPSSMQATYFTMLFEKYFSILKTYDKHTSFDFDAMSKALIEDFKNDAEVELLALEQNVGIKKLSTTLSFNAYTVSIVVIVIVLAILLIYNRDVIMKRNVVSKTSVFKFSAQKYSACLIIALSVFLIVAAICTIVYPTAVFTPQGLLMILYMLLLTVVMFSMGFMFGAIIKKELAVSVIVNLVVLPMAFLSGVFVPQYLLPSWLVTASKILPMSWYVSGLDLLGGVSEFTRNVTGQLLLGYFILVAFAAIFIFIGNFISYRKRKIAG